MGRAVLDVLGSTVTSCRASIRWACPLEPGQKDVPWPCNKDKVHRPLPRRALDLVVRQRLRRQRPSRQEVPRPAHRFQYWREDEGWLAEHMLILGVESPKGEKTYVGAAFPSACGKTNFAMLIPPKAFQDKGWKITTVGDDIAWIKPGADGAALCHQPRIRLFRSGPRHQREDQSQRHGLLRDNSIFTNVALTDDGDVWWEGMTDETPAQLTDWQGNEWTPGCGRTAAHPNARFTAPASQCPSIDPRLGKPRRGADERLYLRRTAQGHGPAGLPGLQLELRRLPGRNHGFRDHRRRRRRRRQGAPRPLRHAPLLRLPHGRLLRPLAAVRPQLPNPPRIFSVNWFRKDANGKFLWPGYGDNMRVLKWIVERVHGHAVSIESPLGWMPRLRGYGLARAGHFSREQVQRADVG